MRSLKIGDKYLLKLRESCKSRSLRPSDGTLVTVNKQICEDLYLIEEAYIPVFVDELIQLPEENI